MANFIFNVAKGRHIEFFERVRTSDPTNAQLVLVMLQTAEADATLIDYDDLATLLAAPGNVEADFTNYARVTYGSGDVAATVVNDTLDKRTGALPLKSIASAGGTLDNTLAKSILCYDPDSTGGTDANLVPIAAYDTVVTTNGQTLNIPAATVIESA